jgi:hypothetical protein
VVVVVIVVLLAAVDNVVFEVVLISIVVVVVVVIVMAVAATVVEVVAAVVVTVMVAVVAVMEVAVGEVVGQMELVVDKPPVVLESGETCSAHLPLSSVHHCSPSTSNCWLLPSWQDHRPKAFGLRNKSKHCPATSIDLRSLPTILNLAQPAAAPTSSKCRAPADLRHPVPPTSRSVIKCGLATGVVVALLLSSFVVEVVRLVATMELVIAMPPVVFGSGVAIILVVIAPVVEVAELVDAMELVVDKPLVVLECGKTSSAHLLLSLAHHCTPSTSNCWLPLPWQAHRPKAFCP